MRRRVAHEDAPGSQSDATRMPRRLRGLRHASCPLQVLGARGGPRRVHRVQIGCTFVPALGRRARWPVRAPATSTHRRGTSVALNSRLAGASACERGALLDYDTATAAMTETDGREPEP